MFLDICEGGASSRTALFWESPLRDVLLSAPSITYGTLPCALSSLLKIESGGKKTTVILSDISRLGAAMANQSLATRVSTRAPVPVSIELRGAWSQARGQTAYGHALLPYLSPPRPRPHMTRSNDAGTCLFGFPPGAVAAEGARLAARCSPKVGSDPRQLWPLGWCFISAGEALPELSKSAWCLTTPTTYCPSWH